MKVAVWDTYVTRKNGDVMHFDILVPEEVKDISVIYDYGKQYLTEKNEFNQPLTTQGCQFCHIEAVNETVAASIKAKGYHIVEMENCV